jgi:hypothetical protein
MAVEFTKLRTMAGFTNEELVGISNLMLGTDKTTKEITGQFIAQAKVSALQNGVLLNEQKLLKDIGKVSAATTLSFGKNPKLIADAVATAKSLGMELSKVDAIAGSLLDFEQSIENELQAELLLGKDINLEKARQAALNNDLATVAKEISEQIGSSAEFSELNRIQQEALAKSVGMSREGLAETLLLEDKLKGLTADKAAAATKDFETLKARVGEQEAMRILEEKGAEGLSPIPTCFSKPSAPFSSRILIASCSPTLAFNVSKSFVAAAALSAVSPFNLSSSNKVSAKPSLLIPTDLANASCWILFNSENSADEPICSDISFATVAKSLFNAACLAFSKLISFPNSNSACNSFSIDCSKSSKLPAIASTLDNSIPKDLAVATASAISFGFLPNDNVVAADTLPISLSNFCSLSKTPFCNADTLA